MSSIYRKNRDGYFYYQTYVYNPKTKKKDKRIFHALNTRNKIEARNKQTFYDKKYKFLMNPRQGNFLYNFLSNYGKTLVTVFCSVFVTLIVINIFQDNEESLKLETHLNATTQNNFHKTDLDIFGYTNEEFDTNKVLKTENLDLRIHGDKGATAQTNKIIVPKFNIIRVDQVSGAFGQGEIHVTVNGPYSSQGLRKICDDVSNRYSEFDNIIICLYLNDKTGRALASGRNNGFTEKQKRDSWIAMYTYNPVEGKFFDDNPGGYLGSF